MIEGQWLTIREWPGHHSQFLRFFTGMPCRIFKLINKVLVCESVQNCQKLHRTKNASPMTQLEKKVALNTQIQLYIIYFARNTNIYIYQYIIFLQQLQLNILVITIDTIQKSSHVRVLSVCWSGIKRSFYLLVFLHHVKNLQKWLHQWDIFLRFALPKPNPEYSTCNCNCL